MVARILRTVLRPSPVLFPRFRLLRAPTFADAAAPTLFPRKLKSFITRIGCRVSWHRLDQTFSHKLHSSSRICFPDKIGEIPVRFGVCE